MVSRLSIAVLAAQVAVLPHIARAEPPTRGGSRAPTSQPAAHSASANDVTIFTPPDFRATSNLIEVTIGDLPIIISAPHGGVNAVPGVPVRTDTTVPQFETVTDTRTRELGEKVIASLAAQFGGAKPYAVLAKFDRSYIDANRQAPYAYEVQAANLHYWAYHQSLQRACDEVTRRYGRGILVDIHGQGTTIGSIYRGTRNGLTTAHLTTDFGRDALLGPNSIVGQMEARGYDFLPKPTATTIGNETAFDGGYITVTYGAVNQAHIDAIQFETGTSLRATAVLQKTADDLAASIAQFAKTYYIKTVPGE